MSDNEQIRQFWNLAQELGTCMLTTHDGDALRSRPMAPLVDAVRGEFRFLTSIQSHKAAEINEDQDVGLAFVDDRDGVYVSVSGRARFSRDRDLIRRQWSEDADLWFPDGPESEDVAVLVVVPTQAEYWRNDLRTLAGTWQEIRAADAAYAQPTSGLNAKVEL